MSGNDGAETLAREEEGEDHLLHLPSKRKPSIETPVSDPKKPKYDGETRVGEEEPETKALNGNAAVVDKGKGILKEDCKGKGKSKIVEPDSSSSSDNDADGGRDPDADDESDFSDDPLAEVDLFNIVSSRTRQRAAHPGAYLDVEDDDDDDDEDDDLVDGEDDSDDEEEDTDDDSE